MKVIMFSTDETVFENGSAFRKRTMNYGKLFDELTILVICKKFHSDEILSESVRIISVGSTNKMGALRELYKKSADIIGANSKDYCVTTQEEFGGLVGYFLKRTLGVRWQAQIHSDIFGRYFRKFSLKNRLRFYIARFILPHASCIRAVSHRIRDSLKKYGIRNQIVVLPVYVDVERFRDIGDKHNYGAEETDFVLLMIGRLELEKNITLALDAFSELIQEHPHTTLRIVGDGSQRDHLMRYTDQLGLRDCIKFEGRGKDSELPFYYERANIFLLTSWYEGYGMVVVEAMASGLPVVMTDVGVAGELLKDGESGLVIEPGDTKGLVDALKKIICDDELRIRLSKNAHSAIEGRQDFDMYLQAFKESIEECGSL